MLTNFPTRSLLHTVPTHATAMASHAICPSTTSTTSNSASPRLHRRQAHLPIAKSSPSAYLPTSHKRARPRPGMRRSIAAPRRSSSSSTTRSLSSTTPSSLVNALVNAMRKMNTTNLLTKSKSVSYRHLTHSQLDTPGPQLEVTTSVSGAGQSNSLLALHDTPPCLLYPSQPAGVPVPALAGPQFHRQPTI